MKTPTIPYQFVLEALDRLSPQIRPMFGCYAIYSGEKMLLILRDRTEHTFDNGVWVAVAKDHHEELKKIFPSLRPVRLLGEKTTAWLNLPKSAVDFEESSMKVCDLILKNDARIGKIPQRKKKKSAIRKR